MKNSILSLGKSLNKIEQKLINGGAILCENHQDCPGGFGCCYSQMLCRTDDYFNNGWCRGQ
ncbi:hypothetical protein [Tenacibaculum sp. Ill]|uniref:hypothetical protein n=1 Tax=Tenacibaculum sp. Ill TaxID=3445935 RepID=UPI003F7A1E7A